MGNSCFVIGFRISQILTMKVITGQRQFWALLLEQHGGCILLARYYDFLLGFYCDLRSTVWLKQILLQVFLKFSPNQNFTCLLYVCIYATLQNFSQLSLTFTNLCHIKCDCPVNFYIWLQFHFFKFTYLFTCTHFEQIMSLCCHCHSTRWHMFIGLLLAICQPSGCTVMSGIVVVVGVCNRSQMRTSKCTCLIFTMRCTMVQSMVLRSHVICPSVCDVGGSWPHSLKILEANCANN